jgi:hypothetical protein
MDDYLVDEIIDLYPPLLQAVDASGEPIAEQLANEYGWDWTGPEVMETKVIFYFDRAAEITSIVVNYGDGDYDHVSIDPVSVVSGDALIFTMTILKNND